MVNMSTPNLTLTTTSETMMVVLNGVERVCDWTLADYDPYSKPFVSMQTTPAPEKTFLSNSKATTLFPSSVLFLPTSMARAFPPT
jgi:hypothetical protein